MSKEALAKVVQRAISDGAFRRQLSSDPGTALRGFDLTAGLRELETAMQLEPGSPQVRIALASAYAKAGRREEAAKQRAEFLRLRKSIEGGGSQ